MSADLSGDEAAVDADGALVGNLVSGGSGLYGVYADDGSAYPRVPFVDGLLKCDDALARLRYGVYALVAGVGGVGCPSLEPDLEAPASALGDS